VDEHRGHYVGEGGDDGDRWEMAFIDAHREDLGISIRLTTSSITLSIPQGKGAHS